MSSVSDRVKILRFRAWLECTDKDESGKEKLIRFPITSCLISVSLNAVPTATITIATGKRLGDDPFKESATNGFSPIHDKDKAKLLLNVSLMSEAKIKFRNLAIQGSDKGDVIFHGFVWQASQSYSQANTEVSVTLVHWLAALDAHPALSADVHPSSVPSYTQDLYHRSASGTTGAEGGGESGEPQSTTLFTALADWAADLFVKTEVANENDFIKDKILNALTVLKEQTKSKPFWYRRFNEQMLNSGLPMSIDEALSRLKTGDAEEPDVNQFPIMTWTEEIKRANIHSFVYHTLISGDNFKQYRQNSLWTSLLFFASQFSFMLVPRVEELRFIPKWFTPKIGDDCLSENKIKVLREAAIVNSVWEHARPIFGAVIVPANISIPDTGAEAANPSGTDKDRTARDIFADTLHAHYYPGLETGSQPKQRGTLLIREPPNWALQLYTHNSSADDHSPETQPKDKEKKSITAADYTAFSSLLAKEAYWDEALKGRRMDVVGPLRFDICPGSTVKVSTGVGRDIRNSGQDALAVDYIGFVLKMQLTFDTINAAAAAQYTLTHVRTMDENDVLLEKHPYYDCKPFAHASWTAGDVKTID